MNAKSEPITYKGRSIGILALTGLQVFIGTIHFIFGLLLLASETSILHATVAYDFYTIAFGILVFVFAIYIWRCKKVGWIGTIAVSLFVIIVDALVVSNLPSIPGVPTFAAPAEIVYSLIVVIYLLQTNVRKKFLR